MSAYSKELAHKKILRIAVFASGSGSNALALMRFFNAQNNLASVVVLLSNKPGCGAIEQAKNCGVEVVIITRENFVAGDNIIQLLHELQIDCVVLAGFLWKVPPAFIRAFRDKIINLHPSLLPKFGGKGMYGRHVHDAVIAAGERVTGITLHLVNENYDEGAIFFQASVPVDVADDASSVEVKVRELERKYLVDQIALFLTKMG